MQVDTGHISVNNCCNNFSFLRNEERGTQNNVYMASTLINEWKKTHFLHDVEKLGLNYYINAMEYTKLQLSSSIISIKNYKYMYINKERAIFWQTWVIKFYSFQANKTFHSRMQDTKTFLTFILCHAYIHHR